MSSGIKNRLLLWKRRKRKVKGKPKLMIPARDDAFKHGESQSMDSRRRPIDLRNFSTANIAALMPILNPSSNRNCAWTFFRYVVHLAAHNAAGSQKLWKNLKTQNIFSKEKSFFIFNKSRAWYISIYSISQDDIRIFSWFLRGGARLMCADCGSPEIDKRTVFVSLVRFATGKENGWLIIIRTVIAIGVRW